MKEFKLSSKGKEWRKEGMIKGDCFFHIEDVKEFIRLLKEKLLREEIKYPNKNSSSYDRVPLGEIKETIDKLSGDLK